jgi:hypothetical protein
LHHHIRAPLALLAVLTTSLVACEPSHLRLPGNLVLEEHALTQPPESDPLSFHPLAGTQEEILAQHAVERSKIFPTAVSMVDDNPALRAPWDGGELVAVLLTAAGDPPLQSVQLSTDGRVVFAAPAGMPSPVLPLRGLWTYDGHWALEILFATPEVWTGQIFVDGELVNQEREYDEAFGFQMLSGKPFFFYRRGEHVGLSYDGQEADLEYDNIPHYLCCSEGVLNPTQAENMVAFFAQHGDTWYYVELGTFE